MNVREELRTFSNDAFSRSLELITLADQVSLGTVDAPTAAANLDRMARDLAAVADTIKDLAYRFGQGQERVTTVTLNVITPTDPVIDRIREYALKRLDLFIGKARTATNEFEIEAQFYAAAQVADKAHHDMHKHNSEVRS